MQYDMPNERETQTHLEREMNQALLELERDLTGELQIQLERERRQTQLELERERRITKIELERERRITLQEQQKGDSNAQKWWRHPGGFGSSESSDRWICDLVRDNRARNIHRYEELNEKPPSWDERGLGSSDGEEDGGGVRAALAYSLRQ